MYNFLELTIFQNKQGIKLKIKKKDLINFKEDDNK